jgi:hypothetical protein
MPAGSLPGFTVDREQGNWGRPVSSEGVTSSSGEGQHEHQGFSAQLLVPMARLEEARGGTTTTASGGDGTASDGRAALVGSSSTEVRQP